MRLKICDSHLTCKVANKCLNVRERVEVVEWNKKWSPPFPCCPVSRQCPWKKTLIEKKIRSFLYFPASPLHPLFCWEVNRFSKNAAWENDYFLWKCERIYPWGYPWGIWVIINTMLVYHFTDPDLGVENSFKKEGAIEKGSIDFEIGD